MEVARRPFQGFFLTYALTVASLAGAAHLWGKVGYDLLLVALGWPHVLLGLAFNLNRIGRGQLKTQLLFGGLLLLSLAIAVGHSQLDITTYIYLYFVFHAFRDEIYIYYERRNDYRFRGRVFDGYGYAIFISAVSLAVVNQLLHRNAALQTQAYDVQCALGALLTVMAILGRPRKLFASRPGLRYAFPAFFLIMTAMTGLEFMRWHQWNAPLFFTFLVIFHYFSWYVFSLQKMGARRQPASTWIATKPGFLTMVLALNVLSFAGAWSYQILRAPAALTTTMAYAFDLKYFLYFLVMHVTTSFIPRPSAGSTVEPSKDAIRERGFVPVNAIADGWTGDSSGS